MTEPTKDVETNKVDTTKAVDPNGNSSQESTPIFDETASYLKDADEVDITHFEEDDDPTQFAGDFVDEDGDGVDDRKQDK